MSTIRLDYQLSMVDGKHKHLMLSMEEFQKFNAGILSLGDLEGEPVRIPVMAAFMDLEGFTAFCGQTDSQFIIPDYMKRLLKWLFGEISARFTKEYTTEGVVMWGKFPFFAKFLGDGFLFLWETDKLGNASLGNIIVNLFKVCQSYTREFLPGIQADFVRPPQRLRCGIARGEVIPLGGGKDFVGPCMNMAARLQQVSGISFAFARKGIDPEACFGDVWQAQFVLKKVNVRGVGNDELVFVGRKELEALSAEERTLFKDV